MQDRGDIFVGHTPGPYRAYLARLLAHAKDHYEHLIVPCAGGFSMIQVAAAAGWEPARCYASDVSLFSLCLASAVNGQRVDGIEFNHETLVDLDPTDPVHVLYAIKVSVSDRHAKQYYQQALVKDLLVHRAKHLDAMRAQVDALAARCRGFHYAQRDLFEHLREAVEDAGAVCYCNPPGYKAGYDKMFDVGDRIQWQPIQFTMFDPKDGYGKVRQIMAGKPSLGIRLKYAQLEPDEKREAIFADIACARKQGIEYLCCNRPEEVGQWLPKSIRCSRQDHRPARIAIMNELDAITADSKITFLNVSTKTALYYRDLFAHRLGITKSQVTYLMLIDGKVSSVVGLTAAGMDYLRRGWILEVFGFSAGLYRYPRLNRLLMMAITCKEFCDVLPAPFARHARGIRTT